MHLKLSGFLSFFWSAILLISCAKEEAVPVVVDFSFDVFNDDFSIPVSIVFFNNTQGAETYQWTFEGGTPATSSNRSPGVVVYNEKGNYSITLTASNEDGSEDSMTLPITIDDPVIIGFELINEVDTFSPAVFSIANTTTGATSYDWTFEDGIPASSTAKDPGSVTFTAPGEHTIELQVSNGRETYDLQKTINVAPFLIADFDYTIAFEDDDLQVPVNVSVTNTSTSATSYRWSFSGANPSASAEENPQFSFINAGMQSITLEATNGKETQTKTVNLSLAENTNLRVIDEVLFGINTAHFNGSHGAFFSLAERKLYTNEELILPENEGVFIDVVFFGLNNTFENNRFVSPNDLEGTSFSALSNAQSTTFINSQEICNCSASLSASQFDAMENDTLLNNLVIESTPGGLQNFNDAATPRVVLFQTNNGLKGAIKITEYVENGEDSYVRASLKYQKAAN